MPQGPFFTLLHSLILLLGIELATVCHVYMYVSVFIYIYICIYTYNILYIYTICIHKVVVLILAVKKTPRVFRKVASYYC